MITVKNANFKRKIACEPQDSNQNQTTTSPKLPATIHSGIQYKNLVIGRTRELKDILII